ncbi:hypothetical protein N7462_002228 [Penicillium macrosclerotiorum]|uniref:uncharacterized protein n=1 Tax=Penicillium macrosclerotiorum TaxID=303699 RepID=UPI0025469474|nr:uncharacterized protein N7462_002228 [Penicillium macrosclerotiorum]KAJ5692805.1 hypothetical protein N7462_002228 [Penicillium macrosclerotiorum]
MQQASVLFSPIKDGRRILGEKNSNACISPAHHGKQILPDARTPVKRTLFMAASPKKLLPSPIFAGQKRTREQVDETDENNGHGQQPRGLHDESLQATMTPDSEELNHDSDALDVRVATPSSQPERDQRDQMDPDRSPNASQCSETSSIPEDPNARKIFIQEVSGAHTCLACLARTSLTMILQKAALLRNTLQTAMRNVTDHQIDRRVSELEAHSRKCPRLSFSALSSSPMSFRKALTVTPSQMKTPRIGSAADLSSTPFQSTPDLPARPSVMMHTSYSIKTGHRTPPRTLGSPMQLSSPPATVRQSRSRELVDGAEPEGDPASHDDLSPSQRGDAVDGLLKLMSTSDRHDNPDAWSG